LEFYVKITEQIQSSDQKNKKCDTTTKMELSWLVRFWLSPE